MVWQRLFLGVIVTVSSGLDEQTRSIGLRMISKVRSAVAQGSRTWSESEWRIAEAFMRHLVAGEQSMLLKPRLVHVFDDESASPTTDIDNVPRIITVETDQFIGLRPEQQQLIQRIYDEVARENSSSENIHQQS